MSTTTNFKRIALVAVAALGLGVLSSVPSQATINADSLTLSSSTATQTTAETYTATSAVATFTFFGAISDSVTLTSALIKSPDNSTAVPVLRLVETSSAVIDTAVDTLGSGFSIGNASILKNRIDSSTVAMNTATKISALSSSVKTTVKYAVYLTRATLSDQLAPATAGEYQIKLTPAAVGVGPLVNATAQTLTITVTTAASLSTTPSASLSTAWMKDGEGASALDVSTATADSTVVKVKTLAATTSAATIYATVKNAAGSAVPATAESLTATITGSGMLGSDATYNSPTATGRTILVKIGEYIGVFSDGTAGTGTITIKGATSGVQIGTVKTVTFTGTTPTSWGAATIAATDSSVIAVAGTTFVSAAALDGTSPVQGLAGGTLGDYWAISSDTTVLTVTSYSGFNATNLNYGVVVTGVAVGSATVTFANASTLAAATMKSTPVTVRVGSGTASAVSVTTDKATYAPGEKITMTVTINDSTAKAVIGKTTYADIFSATGVTASMGLQSGTLPGSTISDYSNTTNTKTFTLYAPVTGGTLTFSWTGGTALATANQVAGTKVVTVTDSGAAALAAVTALATTVASLKTLITTLTNLVLKIQKKVKA